MDKENYPQALNTQKVVFFLEANNDVREMKQVFIEFLYSRPVYKRQVNTDLYLTRCPFCGDSRTTLNTGHLYILVQPDSDAKMVYYCQKCQEHNVVNKDLIIALDGDENLIECVGNINRYGKSSSHRSSTSQGTEFTTFEVTIPDVVAPAYMKKIKYVEDRLGIDIDDVRRRDMKLIVSMYDLLVSNNIKTLQYKRTMMNILERDYVGFMSVGNSHVLLRDVTGTHTDYPWLKYPIFPDSKRNAVFYSCASEIDILGHEPVDVNISEGVMDAVGIKYHFYPDKPNSVNIAAGGRNYFPVIRWLISMGIVGSMVNLNFYLDNDKEFNDGKEQDLPFVLVERTRAVFHTVNAYKNLIGKDYGVKKKDILIGKQTIKKRRLS